MKDKELLKQLSEVRDAIDAMIESCSSDEEEDMSDPEEDSEDEAEKSYSKESPMKRSVMIAMVRKKAGLKDD